MNTTTISSNDDHIYWEESWNWHETPEKIDTINKTNI